MSEHLRRRTKGQRHRRGWNARPARAGACFITFCFHFAAVFCSFEIAPANTASAAELTPEQLFRAPVVYRLSGMDAVRVRQDLIYEKADGVELRADVYLPASSGTFPVVVFLHGGFPEGLDISPKSSGQYTSWGRLVAASGMAGVTFNHRLRIGGSGAVHLADAGSDVRSLLAWLRGSAAQLSLDPRRIAVFAVSAGGPLLTSALGDPGLRCVVDYYGFLDVRGHDWFAKAIAETPGISWSLTEELERGRTLPPIFVARAGLDRVPQMKETIDRFVARALATNVELTLANHPAGQHAFDLQNDDPRSKEIIRSTLAFLRFQLLERERQ
jgi:acetyl esterase/lipase